MNSAIAEAGGRSWARRAKAALERRARSLGYKSKRGGYRRRTVADVVTPHRVSTYSVYARS